MFKDKRNLFIALLLIVCPLIIYWQIGLLQYTLKWDMMDQYFPFRYFIGEAVSNGIVPWWNPYLSLGYPVHADPQSGFWYPITWLLGLNGYSLYDLHIEFTLHLIFSGFGFYKLLRIQQIEKSNALLLALCYQASGFFTGNAQHLTYIIGASYLPWILYCFQQLLNSLKIKYAMALALLLSLLLMGGYPALFIIVNYILLFYFLYWLLQNKYWQQPKQLLPIIKLFFFCGIIFMLMIAGYMLSFIEAKPLFTRGEGVTPEKAMYMSFSPKALISLLFPFATVIKPAAFGSDISMINIYSGLLALLFFPLGIMAKWKEKIFWLATGTICLLASFGEYAPVRLWLYHYVPLMNSFRFPSVFRIFFIISLLLIAAQGLQFFLNDTKKQLPHFKTIAILLLLIISVSAGMALYKSGSVSLFRFWNFESFQNYIDTSSFYSGILIQAIIQLMLLVVIIVVLLSEKIKHKKSLLLVTVIADLFLATQLNINGSAVCEKKVSDYQRTLNTMPKQFPNWGNTPVAILKSFDGAFYPSWSNNAVFFKAISEQNYNPFQLKSFEKYEFSADRYVTLNKPLFYLKNEKNLPPDIIKMQPNVFEAKVNINTADTLCLLQAYYPNWTATVNNKPVAIIEKANGLMAVAVNENTKQVVFQYKPEKFSYLLWLQFLLQGAMVLFLIASKRAAL